MKKVIIAMAVLVVMVISFSAVAMAAGVIKSPAEIIAGLTGKSVEQVVEARQNGTSYGAQAAAAGKLDEFKDQRLEQYKLALDEAVKNKQITQAEADERYAAIQERMENCTGTGTGLGNGRGAGGGCAGNGAGQGYGMGRGMGRFGCGGGVCTATE